MIDDFLYTKTFNRVRTYDIINKVFKQRWWFIREEIPKFICAFCERGGGGMSENERDWE